MLHEGQGRDYERLHISSSDDDWTAMPLKGKLSPSMGSVPVLLSPPLTHEASVETALTSEQPSFLVVVTWSRGENVIQAMPTAV